MQVTLVVIRLNCNFTLGDVWPRVDTLVEPAKGKNGKLKLTVAKEHDYSARKIDACVAAILAWQARLDAVAKGVTQTEEAWAPRRLY